MELTVKQILQETSDVLNIIFEKPKGFEFYPAQFIDVAVNLPARLAEAPAKRAGRQGTLNPDNSRIYSISSSPTEDYLMITFKKGISDHKKKLQTLKIGDTVTITHPNGTYTLDESSPAVMLAGGVGIAPHRSMIKYAIDNKFSTQLTLIYSNSDANFPFKKELDEWQKFYPKLTTYYVVTRENSRLNEKKLQQLYPIPYTLYPIFYLAGPPSFVYGMDKILKKLGIDSTNIRLDSFDGY